MFAEFCANLIQSQREAVRAGKYDGFRLEERKLLGRWFQPTDLKHQPSEAHPSTETSVEQACQQRLEIVLPVGAVRQHLISGLLDVVTVTNSQRDVSAHPLLLPHGSAKLL